MMAGFGAIPMRTIGWFCFAALVAVLVRAVLDRWGASS